jgi:ferredoxin-NADP reductase
MLSSVLRDLARPFFYVCGPPSMCDDVARHLVELGVPNRNIRTEKYD